MLPLKTITCAEGRPRLLVSKVSCWVVGVALVELVVSDVPGSKSRVNLLMRHCLTLVYFRKLSCPCSENAICLVFLS